MNTPLARTLLLIIVFLLVAFIATPRSCTINHVHPKTVIEHELVPLPTPSNPMLDELERILKQTQQPQSP